MKSKAEITAKRTYYQGILAGIETVGAIDRPDVFLALSEYFPVQAMASLRASLEMDKVVQGLPPEDQGWVRRWLEVHRLYLRQVLEERIGILKWVLEEG